MAKVNHYFANNCTGHEHRTNEEELYNTAISHVRYKSGEKVKFIHDVYSMTVAANMNNAVSPREFHFCLRQCVYVFIF